MSAAEPPRKPIGALSAGLLARKGVARKPVQLPGALDLPEMPVARATKDRAAFTLRLDADRRLRLRLASAVTGRSAQQLVTDAVDAMLNDMTELNALARGVAGGED